MVGESVPIQNSFYQPSVVELSRAGNFQAIAHWLNAHLTLQGIHVQVSADSPSCLLLVIEFQRVPDRDRLIRFICHRLCKLNSSVIGNIRLVGRLAGTSTILWDQTVRLATAGNESEAPQVPVSQLAAQSSWFPWNGTQWYGWPRLTGARALFERVGRRNLMLLGAAIAAFGGGSVIAALSASIGASPLSSVQSSPAMLAAPSAHSSPIPFNDIPILPVTPASPDESAITLIFGTNALLNGAPSAPQARGSVQGIQGNNPYEGADVALLTLEQPLEPPNEPARNPGDRLLVERLTQEGVDIVSLAHGAVMQAGQRGLFRTLGMLEQADIYPLGAGHNRQDARRPLIVEVKGQQIAYLSYADTDGGTATAFSGGINPGFKDHVAADIQTLRGQVDWIVVNYHWNQDLAEFPADWQVQLTHFAIDQGADLVVGHHPSVLQGAELYQGKAIAYSLGNFIFENHATPVGYYDSAVLKVVLDGDQINLEFLPVQVRSSQVNFVEGDEGQAILRYLEQASALFATPLIVPRPSLEETQDLDRMSSDSFIESSEPSADPSDPPLDDSFVGYPEASSQPDASESETWEEWP